MVTHDPIDAYALADRVVVLEAGAITQQGSLADVTARPRSPTTSPSSSGSTCCRRAERRRADHRQGGAVVTAARRAATAPAFVAIRPQAISLHRQRPEGSPRNVWQLAVADIDRHHDRVTRPPRR